jgi:hypothetical protein
LSQYLRLKFLKYKYKINKYFILVVPTSKLLEVTIKRVGSGSGLGRVSLTFWKKSDRIGLSQFIVVFFQIFDRFRLDCRSFDFESGRVMSGLDRIISVWFFFFKKSYQIGSNSNPDELDEFVGSGQFLPLYKPYYIYVSNQRFTDECILNFVLKTHSCLVI